MAKNVKNYLFKVLFCFLKVVEKLLLEHPLFLKEEYTSSF